MRLARESAGPLSRVLSRLELVPLVSRLGIIT